jgi:hypothetical protein
MYIARFRVPGLSVREKMGLALGHILWVHALARARFSTQRFGTLYVVVATHKVDGDGGTRLSAATVVLSIVCIDLFTK